MSLPPPLQHLLTNPPTPTWHFSQIKAAGTDLCFFCGFLKNRCHLPSQDKGKGSGGCGSPFVDKIFPVAYSFIKSDFDQFTATFKEYGSQDVWDTASFQVNRDAASRLAHWLHTPAVAGSSVRRLHLVFLVAYARWSLLEQPKILLRQWGIELP